MLVSFNSILGSLAQHNPGVFRAALDALKYAAHLSSSLNPRYSS